MPHIIPLLHHILNPKILNIKLRSEAPKFWVTRTEMDIDKLIYVSEAKRNFEIINKTITKWLKGRVKILNCLLLSLLVLQTRIDTFEPILSLVFLSMNGIIDENGRMLSSFNDLH